MEHLTENAEMYATIAAALAIVALGLAWAVLPAIVAVGRRHHNRLAIVVLNGLSILASVMGYLVWELFWAGSGLFIHAAFAWIASPVMWVVALVWSCTAVRREPPTYAFVPSAPEPDDVPTFASLDDDDDAIYPPPPSLAERFLALPDWFRMILLGLAIAAIPVILLVRAFG